MTIVEKIKSIIQSTLTKKLQIDYEYQLKLQVDRQTKLPSKIEKLIGQEEHEMEILAFQDRERHEREEYDRRENEEYERHERELEERHRRYEYEEYQREIQQRQQKELEERDRQLAYQQRCLFDEFQIRQTEKRNR